MKLATLYAQLIRFLKPTQQERDRLDLALMLFPIVSAVGNQRFSGSSSPLLNRAEEVYLQRFKNQDHVVSCREIVVWRIEREAVLEYLREDFGLLVTDQEFAHYQVRYGLLLRVVLRARVQAFVNDTHLATRLRGEEELERFRLILMKSYAMSLARQILEIDPVATELSTEQEERLGVTVGIGGMLLTSCLGEVHRVLREHGV